MEQYWQDRQEAIMHSLATTEEGSALLPIYDALTSLHNISYVAISRSEGIFQENIANGGLAWRAASQAVRKSVSDSLWTRATIYITDTLRGGGYLQTNSIYSRILRNELEQLKTLSTISPVALRCRIENLYFRIVAERLKEREGRFYFLAEEQEIDLLDLMNSFVDPHIAVLLSPHDGSLLPGGRPILGRRPADVLNEWSNMFGFFHKPWVAELSEIRVSPIEAVAAIGDSYPDLEDVEDVIKQLLSEAWRNKSGCIPWGAYVDVEIGPYIAARVFESQDYIDVTFLAPKHFNFLSIRKDLSGKMAFRPSHATQLGLRDSNHSDDLESSSLKDSAIRGDVHLQLVAAALIRDFMVVEEKVSIFGGVMPSKRPRGCRVGENTTPVIIYLPKVRYTPNKDSAKGISDELEQKLRAHHMVASHLRRLPDGHAPKPIQIELARSRGIEVPESFTFVREHESGASPERQKIYRSRTATGVIFDIVGKAIGRPVTMTPLEFERYCQDWLIEQGWEIAWATSGGPDGGVDIFALRETRGSVEKVVVQCKHYSTPVGVEAIRELASVKTLQSAHAAVLMCSGGVSSKAVIEADALDVEIIDGGTLFKKKSH